MRLHVEQGNPACSVTKVSSLECNTRALSFPRRRMILAADGVGLQAMDGQPGLAV